MNINRITNNANISPRSHGKNLAFMAMNPACHTTTHPGDISYNSGPVIRSVADVIMDLQCGGNLHLAQYQCHELIKQLLLVISGRCLQNPAMAVANTND